MKKVINIIAIIIIYVSDNHIQTYLFVAFFWVTLFILSIYCSRLLEYSLSLILNYSVFLLRALRLLTSLTRVSIFWFILLLSYLSCAFCFLRLWISYWNRASISDCPSYSITVFYVNLSCLDYWLFMCSDCVFFLCVVLLMDPPWLYPGGLCCMAWFLFLLADVMRFFFFFVLEFYLADWGMLSSTETL